MTRGRALASVAAAALVMFGASARPSAQAAPAAAQPAAKMPAPAQPPAAPSVPPAATAPAATAPAAEQVPPGAKPGAPPATGSAYTYAPEGRRDPFLSLVGRGNDPKNGARPAGAAGLLINEVSIKGIIRDRSGFVAMIQGPENKTFVVRAGDRLMDGTVKSIVQDAVVFSQDVNDPLSLVKQKEIRKTLRTLEGGRG
jgi:nucleoid-associated protein YgaU